jgi:chemotaxis protein MotB
MRKSRNRFDDEHEEHIPESWLLPYADILTLLLALFIVLFASSEIDKEKFQAIMESFQTEFTGREAMTTTSPLDSTVEPEIPETPPITPDTEEKDKETEELDQLKQRIEKYIKENKLEGMVTLQDTRRGIEIAFKDVILFDSGRANLKKDVLKTMDKLIGLIKSVPNSISIEGHTDDVPIGNAPFSSNWELSSERALSVLEYFASKDIPENRLGFTGYGEFQPLVPNDSDKNRQENRRVNIVILRDNQGL